MAFNFACTVSKTAAAHPFYSNDSLSIVSEWPGLALGVNRSLPPSAAFSERNRADQSPQAHDVMPG